jgi:hypothetical protein
MTSEAHWVRYKRLGMIMWIVLVTTVILSLAFSSIWPSMCGIGLVAAIHLLRYSWRCLHCTRQFFGNDFGYHWWRTTCSYCAKPK